MRTIVFLGLMLSSFHGFCDTQPSLFKEISRKTKISPEKWLSVEQRSLSVEVTFYIQNNKLRIQHIESDDDEIKASITSSLNKIILKGSYKEFKVYTLRYKFEREQ